jgi:hypothetical protein
MEFYSTFWLTVGPLIWMHVLRRYSKMPVWQEYSFSFKKNLIYEHLSACTHVFLVLSPLFLLCCVHLPIYSNPTKPLPLPLTTKMRDHFFLSDKQFQLAIWIWGLVQQNQSYGHRTTLRHYFTVTFLTIPFLCLNSSNCTQSRHY